MPPVRMRGDGRKAKNPRKTLLRLLGYMKPYLPTLGVVLLCIIANAIAQTAGSRSLGTLVLKDYDALCGEKRTYYPVRKMAHKRALLENKRKSDNQKKGGNTYEGK